MCKLSIIVPCYGVEKYLNRCLNSLVSQTLKDFEIILVDDHSLDNVPSMCDEWSKRDSRIKVIHKVANEGLGYARNTGLKIATGEYVAFVDSDDFVAIEMYQKLLTKALKANADVVYCNCIFYKNENSQKIRKDVETETTFDGREAVNQFLLDVVAPLPSYKHDAKYMISVWHAIYKKKIFDSHNIQFVSEREIISEDLIFDIDYLCHCEKVIYLPEAYYYYCENGTSLSRKIDKTRYKRIKEFLNAVESRLSKLFPKETYLIHFYRQMFICMRISMKYVYTTPEMGIQVNEVTNDSYWQNMLCNYPYWKMDFKHLLFFFCIKHKIIFLIKPILSKI